MTEFSKQQAGPASQNEAPSLDITDLYSRLSDKSQDLLCTHDLRGKLLSISAAPALLLGYEVEELLQLSLPELLVPEFRQRFGLYLDKIQRDGVASGRMTVLTRTGERRVWEYHNTLSTEASPPFVLGMAHDVTEHVKAEHALRSSEEKFRTVFQNAAVGMVLVSPEGRFLEANESFLQFLGYTLEELRGKTIQDVTHPDELERTLWAIEQTVSGTQRIHRFEKRYVHKTGETRWGEVSSALIRNLERNPDYCVGEVLDVTQRKRAEEQLRLNLRQTTLLWRISDLVSSKISVDHVVHAAVEGVTELLGCDVALLFEKQGEELHLLAMRAVEPRFTPDAPIAHCLGQCLCGLVARNGQPIYCKDIFNDPRCTWEECKKAGLQSFAALPLKSADGVIGVLGLASATTHDYENEASFLETLAAGISVALANSLLHRELQKVNEELQKAKEKLTEEKLYLEQAIDTELGFDEIIGKSEPLREVLEAVATVAASDSTVLLLGETGTGKELIARLVHRMSKRKGRPFIKMNCAAIPSGLLESELFGHEKGAFTGAVVKKLGRLELADKGTLFLDEIGEMPLHLQPKLLRVLQDQEFERLGGNQTLKVDFRLIAATNQDLIECVEQKRFRADLYYRLNVFPVCIPPLRERRGDIPLLVEHFVRKHAQRMKKTIAAIPQTLVDALVHYGWPGNVRELENFVERSVILTRGSVLEAPIRELEVPGSEPSGSLELAQREHILRTLKESGGRLSGPDGAAARLGLPRTTLQSKLKQMGIDPRLYRAG